MSMNKAGTHKAVTDNDLTKIKIYKVRMDAEYQRSIDKFVGENVLKCMSVLVSEIWKSEELRCGEYEEEFNNIDSKQQFTRTFNYECGCDHSWSIEEIDRQSLDSYNTDLSDHEANCPKCKEIVEPSDCESEDADYLEVFEHWLVSDQLLYRLESEGEQTSRDFFSLNIWGRTTTGQGIAIDDVICNIFDALYPEIVQKIRARLIAEKGN